MVSAGLSVELTKDGVALSKLDLSILLEVMELPLDE